jgi:hypothetical protein
MAYTKLALSTSMMELLVKYDGISNIDTKKLLVTMDFGVPFSEFYNLTYKIM